ncbi:MAG: damage-control phosphatase ARMT1 family protein [Peptococcaceae bacterium]|nr:damage-control phosphatase ARMT1 family protein [Peptococcaceae bacterium]
MHILSEDLIRQNLHEFLCDYREVDGHALIKDGFVPQTFSVAEKRRGCPMPYFSDVGYDQWIDDLLLDVVSKLGLPDFAENELFESSRANLHMLLRYSIGGCCVEELIYNQEFVDIIRNVVGFTLYGQLDTDVDCARKFNGLAAEMMPFVIKRMGEMGLSREVVLKLSIAGGLSGLDLKGAPSASSPYVNQGIAMKEFLDIDPVEAAARLLDSLLETVQRSAYPFFEWDQFEADLAQCGRIAWLTDDYIESYLDLVFINRTLDVYPGLTVELIPKNGSFGNDMSWRGVLKVLRDPLFADLREKYKGGRLVVARKGPKMGSANLRKMSVACLDGMLAADLIVVKGCRMHEMLQGGVMKDMYSAYVVCRSLSEIVTGLDARVQPILLFKLAKGRYAFWGKRPGEMSTLSDHKRRLALASASTLVKELASLRKLARGLSGGKEPLYCEIAMLEEKLARLG